MRLSPLFRAGAAALTAFGAANCADPPTTVPTSPTGTAPPVRHTDSTGTHHSHWRYGHLTWAPRPDLGPRTIQFTYRNAFRRSGYGGTAPDGLAAVGDIIVEYIGATGLDWGDGSAATGTLRYIVTSINPTGDWLFVEALNPGTDTPGLIHTYPANGAYTATSFSCCRIGGLQNAGFFYGASTIVTVGNGNSSPISNIVPIVNVAQGGVRSWTLPATDANGDRLRFRLADATETQGGDQPPGLTINPTSGVLSWNTAGLPLGLYWTQQTVEELNPNGSVKGKVTVDYLINLQQQVAQNDAPVFSTPACNSSRSVLVGRPLSLQVRATDPNAGDVVSLLVAGAPPGATFNATAGNPATGTFAWTPLTSQSGPRIVTFSATDDNAAQTLCSVTIVASFQMDVWPGNISLARTASVWVLVLSTADFDARNIDLASARLGNAVGTDTPMLRRPDNSFYFSERDFNNDGRPDRALFFSVPAMRANGDIAVGQPELVLTGVSSVTGQFRGVSRVMPTITP